MRSETIERGLAKAVFYRDAPSIEGKKTAAVGAFCCPDTSTGKALLGDITAKARDEGFDRLIGPMDGSTWHNYRLVSHSDGSPAFLMEPKSQPHDLQAFYDAGFREVSTYFSARATVQDALARAIDPDASTLIEAWDGTDPEAYFSDVHRLSCQAFAQNAYYAPIERDAFIAMYMPFVPMLKKELILMARDRDSGELIGFLFGIPNYQEGRAPKSVILKTYASLRPGVGSALSYAFHRAAHAAGYETVIHALIHDDNTSANRSRKHGATVFRRYVLMGRHLNG